MCCKWRVICIFIISLERTSTSVRMEALGVAMAAGQADGIGVWDLYKEPETAITHDVFIPTTTHEGKAVQGASSCSTDCQG